MMRIIRVKNFSDRPKHLPIRSMAVKSASTHGHREVGFPALNRQVDDGERNVLEQIENGRYAARP